MLSCMKLLFAFCQWMWTFIILILVGSNPSALLFKFKKISWGVQDNFFLLQTIHLELTFCLITFTTEGQTHLRETQLDNKHVIYFYLSLKNSAYWARGRDEGEEEKSNKAADLYGGSSLLSHVIPWELTGALRSYFLTVKRPAIHPPPQLRQ